MKKFLFILLFLGSFTSAFSQAAVTSTGIAIQGIAKKSDNTAIVNTTVPIIVDIYTTVSSTNYSITTNSGNVNTDAFGVFAYVVPIDSSTFLKISNSEAYIRIKSNNVVFATEKLQAAPYAIHAQNGVPTGAIMPFAGDVVPAGWLPADGSPIPTGAQYDALRAIMPDPYYTPNLKGVFLQGTGSQTINNVTYTGPVRDRIVLDNVGNHTHTIPNFSGTTSSNGDHAHGGRNDRGGNLTLTWTNYLDHTGDGNEKYLDNWTSINGSHAHDVPNGSGTSGNQTGGQTETRPVNYGVQYIIKI